MKVLVTIVVMSLVFSWCFYSYSVIEKQRWEEKANDKIKIALSDPNIVKNVKVVEVNSVSK